MKKTLLFAGILTLASITLTAQEYKTAVGIRLGPNSPMISSGFTVKHFIRENRALEGLIGLGNGFALGALYEWHNPIPSVEHLQWFAGAGGYLGFRDSKSYVGAAGIVGLDYKFPAIPLNISIDWKPELNIISDVGYEGAGVGLSARFTF